MSTENRVVIAKVTGVFGVKGWLKIYSYTRPMENFSKLADSLYLQPASTEEDWVPVVFDKVQKQGKGLVAHIKGCDDRDQAKVFTQRELAVNAERLPSLEEGEFYWHQLEGLRVFVGDSGDEDVLLGYVDHLMETGANDVLVVKACEGSMDGRERLIPYLPGKFVRKVNLDAKAMWVDWDPEF